MMDKLIKQQYFNKYFYILFCLLFICNNAFAVKPLSQQDQTNPSLNMEASANSTIDNLSHKKLKLKDRLLIKILQKKINKSKGALLMDTSSIRKELLITHAKDPLLVKKISEGNIVSIRTNENVRYDGVLKIIDDEHISVRGQIVALADIDRIHKIKKKRTGAILITTGIVLFLTSIGLLSDTNFDLNPTRVGLLFLLILLSFLAIFIGALILLIKKVFRRRNWKYKVSSN